MRILAIGAHFDDVELGCGGTIARHARAGDEVTIYVATNSGYTDYNQKVIRQPDVALAEGKAAAKELGAHELICGDFPTNDIEWDDELACAILKIIDERKIEQVYTHWTGDIHHDHKAVSHASIAAARHVPRVFMYRSNYYDSPQSFRGNFYVDITDTLEQKKASIRAHESEYNRIGERWLQFFINQNENDGMKIGVKHAECFEVLKYLMA